jgi:hypothetical protein
MFKLELQWKEFKVDVKKVIDSVKLLSDIHVGTVSGQSLELWFSSEPSNEVKAQILAYWDSIDAASIEAVTYKSADQLKQESDAVKLANINSAKAKLAALGLSEAEISAIIGV